MRVVSATHYDTLGVAPTADAAVIKAAYRALSRTHHPDAGGEPEKFMEITSAYDILSDPSRRASYDTTLAEIAARNRGAARPTAQTPPRPHTAGPASGSPRTGGAPRTGGPASGWFTDPETARQRAEETLRANAQQQRREREHAENEMFVRTHVGTNPADLALFQSLVEEGHDPRDAVRIVADAKKAARRARWAYVAAGAFIATLWGAMRLWAPSWVYGGPSIIEGHIDNPGLLFWFAVAGAAAAHRAAAHIDGPVLWVRRQHQAVVGAAAGAVLGVGVTADTLVTAPGAAGITVAVTTVIGAVVGAGVAALRARRTAKS